VTTDQLRHIVTVCTGIFDRWNFFTIKYKKKYTIHLDFLFVCLFVCFCFCFLFSVFFSISIRELPSLFYSILFAKVKYSEGGPVV
jgi:hypothetical protein